MRTRRHALLTLAVAACLAGAASAPVAVTARGLTLGFYDEAVFQNPVADDRVVGLRNATSAGAAIVRLGVQWSRVAPTRPPTRAAAQDPGWPGYDWSRIDASVRDAVAAGLRPLLTLWDAPGWAEGARRPSKSVAPAGSWRPSIPAFGDFATAAARRYTGSYASPDGSGALPEVGDWQAWNEPNLYNYLMPQWRKLRSGRFEPASPGYYRRLLNRFYAAVKAVSADNAVVAAGTAPFGDLNPGDPRMPPAKFVRSFLCVKGRAKPRAASRCAGGPVRFDVLAHHPYPIGPPRRKARNTDDVVIPDFHKLIRPLRVAERAGHVGPRGTRSVWATEISWDSSPPDPDGIPAQSQARYLAGALYVLWRQGVSAVTWFLMRDQAKGRGFEFTYQSGIYYRGDSVTGDRPKPSFRAYRFPFTAYRTRGVARLWGLAPPGRRSVTIERSRGGTWRAVKLLPTRGNRLFLGRLRVGRGVSLRARAGQETSLPWVTF